MSKTTVKVIKTAFYDGELVRPGKIIKNYEGELPTWATLADGKEQKKPQPKQPEVPVNPNEQGKKTEEQVKTSNDNAGLDNNSKDGAAKIAVTENEPKQPEVPVKTELELQEELEKLLTEAIEKNIYIENTEQKTVIEQIKELKAKLEKE